MIAGTAKGHKLKTLKGSNTRPTADRVKESLFNIIADYVYEADVLDLYAGTGNLGIEALSRGASSAVFVDRSSECLNIIKDNLNHTKLSERAFVITADVHSAIKKAAEKSKRFDIIFLDPPYNKNLIEETLNFIVKNDIIKDDTIIVAERDAEDAVPEYVEHLKLVRNQKYGDTIISFYRHMPEEKG